MTRAWLLALVLPLFGASCEPDPEPPCVGIGVICRIAGTGSAGFNGDGKPGSRTELYLVSAVRRGPDGSIYLMDFNNHRLRRVEADGRIATVAGNGLHELATVGVPATASGLENPYDFAFGPDGTLYLASYHDPRVLRIRADGVLESIAGTGEYGDAGDGGPAEDALFAELTGIAVTPDGTVLVVDEAASRVRSITPDGIVHAFAGEGIAGYRGDGGPAAMARLNKPLAVAVAADGAVYVADTDNHAIRRVDAAGTITTFAGTGVAGAGAPGGLAAETMLTTPEGVATAPDGRVFISDSGNNRVLVVGTDGVVARVAGNGTAGLRGDRGPALEAELHGPARLEFADGILYIADHRNNCARLIQLE